MKNLGYLPNKWNFSVPEYKTEHFDQINGWVDLINDPMQLLPLQALDTSNVIFTQWGWKKRPWIKKYLSTDAFSNGSSIIKSLWILNSRMFKIVRASNVTKLQAADTWWAWADVTNGTLTDSTRNFDLVNGRGLSVSASQTWLATTQVSARSLVTGTAMTINAYVGQFVKITSWAGSGQIAMITVNTTNTVFIEWTFDITPAVGDTFSIFPSEACLYVGNASNNFKRVYYSLSSAPVAGAYAFSSIEYHKNRLYGTVNGRLYFSNLWNGDYVWPNSYVEVGTYSSAAIIKSFWDRLVIDADDWRYDLYWDWPDNFILQKRSDKTICSDWLSGYNNISNASNTQFFLSFQGLENLFMIENASANDSIPVSSNIMLLNTFWKYAQIGTFNNRVYVFSSSVQYGTTPTRFYIYDIKQSMINQYPTWSLSDLPKTVTAVCWDNVTTRMYIAYDGVVWYFDENVSYDWDLNFPCSFTTPRRIQKDPRRKKKYIKCEDKFYVTLNGTIQIYASYFWWAYNLIKTQVFTGTTAQQEIQINTFLNGLNRDISFKYVCTPTWEGGIFENISHDLFYNYLPKTL